MCPALFFSALLAAAGAAFGRARCRAAGPFSRTLASGSGFPRGGSRRLLGPPDCGLGLSANAFDRATYRSANSAPRRRRSRERCRHAVGGRASQRRDGRCCRLRGVRHHACRSAQRAANDLCRPRQRVGRTLDSLFVCHLFVSVLQTSAHRPVITAGAAGDAGISSLAYRGSMSSRTARSYTAAAPGCRRTHEGGGHILNIGAPSSGAKSACMLAEVGESRRRVADVFTYHPTVLEELARHGLQPLPTTPPQQLRDAVRDLYKYEIKRLRADLLAERIRKVDYAGHVIALRRRYQLLSVPLPLWTAPCNLTG